MEVTEMLAAGTWWDSVINKEKTTKSSLLEHTYCPTRYFLPAAKFLISDLGI
jgi:hypothetical protein